MLMWIWTHLLGWRSRGEEGRCLMVANGRHLSPSRLREFVAFELYPNNIRTSCKKGKGI